MNSIEKLKCLSWNVHGLTSVYNDNDFLNLVDSYDILFLSETWLNDSNLIDIDGFVKISCVNRSVNIGKRNDGGLAVFCRHFLNDVITVEKELNYGIVFVKLKCDFFILKMICIYVFHMFHILRIMLV